MKSTIKSFLIYLLVFLIFFGIFLKIQFSFPNIVGGDGYYHIKQAWLIRTEGIKKAVREFSFLQCSIFKEYPGDIWFGFHLLLYPFTFFDLIFGAKLSSAFFASILLLGFFWVFKKFKIKYPFFWTIFLFLVTNHFNFRLLLPRPHVLSILFSVTGFYFLFRKKHWEIFFLSFIYSFVTTESLLILVMAFCLALLERLKTKKLDLKPLAITLAGFLLGLILQPDFPNNFYLLYHQIFSVLSLKFTGVKLSFGAELHPFYGLVKDNILLFLTFILPLLWTLLKFIQKKYRNISFLHLSLFSFSFGFAILSFINGRFIEYWVPFSVLFFAVWSNFSLLPAVSKIIKSIKEFEGYHLVFSSEKIKNIYQSIYNFLRIIALKSEKKLFKFIILGLSSFLVIAFLWHQVINLSVPFGTEPLTLRAFKEASLWLKENTPKNSIVLNSAWDTFPFLFFYNHQNFYCNGMDPTFMYVKNPKIYWIWQNLTGRGISCDKEECDKKNQELTEQKNIEISRFLKETLRGDYLLLDNPNEKFSGFLSSSPDFEKVFKKGRIEIYSIK